MKTTIFNIEEYKRTYIRAGLVAIFVILMFLNIFGEKVPMADGAGWDGQQYRSMCLHFSSDICSHSYDTYYIGRVAPFAVVNLSIQILGLQPNNSNTMIGVVVLNCIMMVLSLIAFFIISNSQKWKIGTEIISFASLYFIYPHLKNLFYYPFLTDGFAFSISMWILCAFIKKWHYLMYFLGVISAFVWKTNWIFVLLLLFLPRTEFRTDVNWRQENKSNTIIINIVKTIISLSPTFVGLYLNYNITSLRFINSLIVSCFLFVLLFPININLKNWIATFYKNANICYLLIAVGSYLIVKYCQNWLSSGIKNEMFYDNYFLENWFLQLSKFPLGQIGSYFVYYGIFPLLLILNWNSLVKQFGQYGYGFFIIIALSVYISTYIEARFNINALPFWMLLFANIINRIELKKWILIAYPIMQLIISKFWFTINTPNILTSFESGNLNDFPAQRYFMQTGMWTSAKLLAVHTFVAFCLLIFIYVLNKKHLIYENDKSSENT